MQSHIAAAAHQLLTLLLQVDALWPGFLGLDRIAFSHRYCSRRLVPVKGRGGSNTQRWDNSGLSCGGELHAMLKQVGPQPTAVLKQAGSQPTAMLGQVGPQLTAMLKQVGCQGFCQVVDLDISCS